MTSFDLKNILENAQEEYKEYKGGEVDPKDNKSQEPFEKMIILYCEVECELAGVTVKIIARLIIGRFEDSKKHVQYCLTAVE